MSFARDYYRKPCGGVKVNPHNQRTHERFCCNRRSLTQARRARLAGIARQGGTGLTRHASLALRASLATRLRDFATNRHELCGLTLSVLFVVGALAIPCGAQTPPPAPTP